MIAEFTAEDDGHIGIDVIDNLQNTHDLTLRKEGGEIVYHQCEAYDDKAANRTPAENEYNEQARKFAQYYVYSERDYNTVPAARNPDALNAVRVALSKMPTERFETLFADLHHQLQSHAEPAVTPVVDIPAGAADPSSVLYRQHIYLGVDPFATSLREETQALAADCGLDLSDKEFAEISSEEMVADGLDSWQEFADAVSDRLLDADDADVVDSFTVDSVSTLHMAYLDDRGREHVTDHTPPVERAPDARLELPVMEPGSLEEFQAYLVHNIACQIRDAFVRMGLEPPEPFQLLGYGGFEAAEQYQTLDMYPDYVDPEETRAFQ